MATTIPKSKTGVASNKADYSIVEGNPQATEVNRLRAEGALAKSDIKTGKSIKAKDALKSPLPVASSSTATSDLQRKLTEYRDILQGMADQKARVEQQNALEKQQADAQKQAEADARMASEKLKIEKQNADTKASLASGGVVGNPLDAYLTGKGQDASIQSKADLAVKQGLVASPMEYRQAVQNGTVADLDNQLVSKLQENTNEIQTGSSYTDQQYGSDVSTLLAMSDKMYDNFIRQTNQIKNGTFPLSASENAILSETQKAFERSKEEQRKSNEGFVGSVKLSGMRRGGEYTDKQYAGEIQQAVSDGIQKIADIDSKAALTMAELQKGFDEENYKIINDQYTAFNNLMKSKGDAIAELHKSAAEHEKFVYQKAKDQKDLEQRAIENEREATKLADDLLTSSSNRATDALQRERLVQEITAAKNEALSGVPLLPKNVQTNVDKIVGQFDNEPIVKNYNTAILAKQFVDSLPEDTQNPSDDQALIYAFAKIMDPDSVVREGEYATVQKYAQSWTKAFGKSVNQAINGTGFLSEDARRNMKDTIGTRVNVMQQQYDNVYNEYGRRVENVGAPQGAGTQYLTDYSGAFKNIQQDPLNLGIKPVPDEESDPLQLR